MSRSILVKPPEDDNLSQQIFQLTEAIYYLADHLGAAERREKK